ncbi:hypothetical protein PoB_001613800 [Plakobranchus ocellatus]|uniref:Uncharacterized protein n=1 Tax=Plakobranchus ocellatus TaxID=259542 RepID=A0AAV3Z5A3_9GAST|nr:hypothetical protein PoB_001613800 [Plakobranchus ocellatus]
MKFTKKTAWGIGRKRQMMADDTKAYFQEVIRGAGLFGILTRSGSTESRASSKGGAETFMDRFDDGLADLPEPRELSVVGQSPTWSPGLFKASKPDITIVVLFVQNQK